jgi:uncharacterized protein YukE
MASLRLHMTYDDCAQAITDNANATEDFRGQLANINSAVSAMGATFKGKAGRSFVNYWQGTGVKHSNDIIRHLESLDDKLQKIMTAVEENDDACAQLFSWGR